jgi:hypothetical protein
MKRREDDDVTECTVCLCLDDDQSVCADRKCPNTIHSFCSPQCIECGQRACPDHAVRFEGEDYCSACYEQVTSEGKAAA